MTITCQTFSYGKTMTTRNESSFASNVHDDSSSNPENRGDDGVLSFDMTDIRDLVLCQLCGGLLKEPYTTIKCWHTFCKSCLSTMLYSRSFRDCKNYNSCLCGQYFGRQTELASIALADRTMESIIDKVLFPEISQQDRYLEQNFYEARVIERKDASKSNKKKRMLEQYEQGSSMLEEREVVFQLLPHSSDQARLERPFLSTSGSIRMRELKKFLRQQLHLLPDTAITIFCHSVPLGNELCVTFIHRTVWDHPTEKLTLTYRY